MSLLSLEEIKQQFAGSSIEKLIEDEIISRIQHDLFYVVKSTKFGKITEPSQSDCIRFILDNYCNSFVGGASAYNSLGLSTQVPNVVDVFTNELIPYEFNLIKITNYEYTIIKEYREIYPLVEFVINGYAFSDNEFSMEVVSKLLKKILNEKKDSLDVFPEEIKKQVLLRIS